MKFRLATAAFAASCILNAIPALGAPVKMIGSIDVPRAAAAPRIDGSLADPAWAHAAKATLTYDLRTHGPAIETTTWYLMADDSFLYVAVDARQASSPIRATQHTNGVGLDTDDEVQIDLWPNGTQGFGYKFTSTPIGTHYQFSTENNDFEPTWASAGSVVPGGYIVTMRVPLAVMHGTGAGGWRVQLVRYIETTNTVLVWSYGSEQGNFNDVNYSGALSGLPRLAALREKPRLGVYGLGEIASPSVGGSTSRMGADLSVPLVSGTAFVGTFHPDYSDVAIDQQTISPTAFARYFQEVRPFFTQGFNFESYPDGTCVVCPLLAELYTPAIPTPRDGYAVEGERGLFNYVGFDAIGDGRTDAAQALNYKSPNQENSIDFQGSESNQPLLHDAADGFVLTHDNTTDFKVFARYANDAGTDVLVGDEGQRYEGGFVYYTPTSSLQVVDRKIGAYFRPIDGLVGHPDTAGYAVGYSQQFKFPQGASLTEIDFNGDVDRYHDHTGELDQTDNIANVSATTRTLFGASVSTGSSYDLIVPGAFVPITQAGMGIGYNLNGSTPTSIQRNTGHFGIGPTDSWTRSTTMKAGPRGLFSFDDDDTDQSAPGGQRYTQWLERASFAYQETADQSIAIGVRRIIGTPPAFFVGGCTPRAAVNCPVDAWNISGAFRRKWQNGELYLVYGDAALFATAPQFIVKYVRYFGADKGT